MIIEVSVWKRKKADYRKKDLNEVETVTKSWIKLKVER